MCLFVPLDTNILSYFLHIWVICLQVDFIQQSITGVYNVQCTEFKKKIKALFLNAWRKTAYAVAMVM